MNQQKRDRVCEVLRAIAADMEADATAFDGRPFNGRTVAEYFGNHGAAIAALARAIEAILSDVDSADPARGGETP